MANFKEAYKKTMGHEGGYVSDPTDVGGETYKGVSRVYNPSWSGWVVIDAAKDQPGFPGKLSADAKLQVNVGEFYKDKYWDVNRLDEFKSQAIAEEMFDTGVNMGISRAAKFLQESLNYLNRNGASYEELVVDGKIGPASLNALAHVQHHGDAGILLKMLNVCQGRHYMEYMKKSPTQEKYARGWFKRVN